MEYKLKCGSLTAIADSYGGELISLKDAAGREYLWQGDPAYWSGRNPNLFPIVGGLKDGTICVNGVPYCMNRHGFARNSEFSIMEQGDDYIVFQLVESEFTLQLYPFRFDFRIRHQLTEFGFFTQFEVHNPGEAELPFCVGAHTAFNCPMKDEEHFDQYRLVFDQTEDAHALYPTPTGCLDRGNKLYTLQNTDTLPLDHETYAQADTLIFEGLKSTGVKLLGPDGHGIRMDYSGFPMIAFWTAGAKQAPYICLEPWSSLPSRQDVVEDLEKQEDLIALEAGNTYRTTWALEIK